MISPGLATLCLTCAQHKSKQAECEASHQDTIKNKKSKAGCQNLGLGQEDCSLPESSAMLVYLSPLLGQSLS